MSTSRPPLKDRSNLQIRIVPYSPPRLSSDLSVLPRPDEDACKPCSGPSPANVEVYQNNTPQTRRMAMDSSPALPSPVSPLGPYAKPPDQETDGRRASTPRRPSTSSSGRRLRHVVNVHSDKTFSLLAQAEYESSSMYSSSFLNSTLTSTTYGRNSSVTFSYGRRSSTLALQQPESVPTSPEEKTPPQPNAKNVAATASPWNYEFVGGLRKVYHQTPEPEFQSASSPITTPSKAHLPLSNTSRATARHSLMLIPRKPLPSSYTASPADTDTPNFRVIRQTLPEATIHGQPSLEFSNCSPSSDQNYRILGDSGSSDYSLGSQSRPRTEDSEPNCVKLDGASSPSIAATPSSRLKSEFSRESLIVAPLNPARKLFTDKSFPVELPQRGSSPRFLATWSAMINHDTARALFGSKVYPARPRHNRTGSHGGSPFSTPKAHQCPPQPPLSTVFSESEEENERLRGSMSPVAAETSTSQRSRDYVTGELEPTECSVARQTTPASEAAERPKDASGKARENEGNLTYHLVGDQDEHGDGLTDLRDLLTHRPSRKGGFPSIMPNYGSDRNLWSSASARATNWAIPAWARLYYGSGERRFLAHQASRDSIRSTNADSQTRSSFQRRSHSVERVGIFSQRQQEPPTAANGSAPITIRRSYPDLAWARTLKKQTSSLWSPHLRRDNRANSYGIWDPPIDALSVDGCITARRNVQVVLFMSGFLFPIAWMVAAFIPLPTNRALNEKDFPSTSHIDLTEDDNSSPSQLAKETALYNRAKWWRDLNRAMAIIGLLIIGAFTVLIALGVQQRWR
ncbi:serine-rich protein [Cordyceps javanica]|uniref:Serine-rich protein n=1 Tax=Cordyceps javanica TaxID=43265 RepID=A0A545USC7_9HYPO|nr:serine-rich protein [Cordyceps javanica]TQW04401.1 serine-rich protein [Cordyceps javanica]